MCVILWHFKICQLCFCSYYFGFSHSDVYINVRYPVAFQDLFSFLYVLINLDFPIVLVVGIGNTWIFVVVLGFFVGESVALRSAPYRYFIDTDFIFLVS